MRHRSAIATLLVLASTLPVAAQTNSVYSRAIPPDKAAMERLNLKIEWTANIPVEGRRDSLTQIQTIDDQLFIQTRTGLLIAGDAVTGQLQWFAQLGNGDYANTYPVAANSEYVYVAHVTKLHAFHRYTGVVEFVTDLGSPPTTGLAADESGVYCVVGLRSGSSGSHRVAVYNLPRPIAISDVAKGPGDPNKPPVKDPKAVNPVDNLMRRYAPESVARQPVAEAFERSRYAANEVPTGGATGSRTPSLGILPKITPPYTLQSDTTTPSITILPSLRQPYHLRTGVSATMQRTPSIGVIPPSVAASLALADLRPKNVEPPLRWEYGMASRILYPVFLTPTRAWVITDNHTVTALNKRDKKIEVLQRVADPISAPPGHAGLFVYLPLGSGYVVAIEGTAGSLSGGANILWRSPVGGIANRTPFVTENFVYAEGDNSGVVCIDRKHGEIVWKSDSNADRLIGANHEFVYIRDRQGKFLVYDAKRPSSATDKRSSPLAGINLAEFNVNIVNTASDRIYLAADNGLIVCLRDMNAKYARPVRITPEPIINLAARAGVEGAPVKDGDPKKDPGEPKKDPEPKKGD